MTWDLLYLQLDVFNCLFIYIVGFRKTDESLLQESSAGASNFCVMWAGYFHNYVYTIKETLAVLFVSMGV